MFHSTITRASASATPVFILPTPLPAPTPFSFPLPTRVPTPVPSVAPSSLVIAPLSPSGLPETPVQTPSAHRTLGDTTLSVLHSAVPAVSSVTTLAIALPVLVSGLSAAMASGGVVAFGLFNVRHALEVVGLKRRPRIWGVIYDSKTKKPVPYAKIELKDFANRVLETRFTDRDGRYGFLTSPSSLHAKSVQFSLAPSARDYAFPSARITADTDFIVYDHIYRGGLMTLTNDLIVNFNIPLDPTTVSSALPSLSRPLLSRSAVSLLDIGFWLGLLAAPLNAILQPSAWSVGILVVFLAVNVLRLSLSLFRPFGLVYDAASAKPLPYALVTLNDTQGKRLSFSVSDELGRYFLLADPGTYDLTVFTPAQVQPQRSQTLRLTSRKGWLRSRVRV